MHLASSIFLFPAVATRSAPPPQSFQIPPPDLAASVEIAAPVSGPDASALVIRSGAWMIHSREQVIAAWESAVHSHPQMNSSRERTVQGSPQMIYSREWTVQRCPQMTFSREWTVQGSPQMIFFQEISIQGSPQMTFSREYMIHSPDKIIQGHAATGRGPLGISSASETMKPIDRRKMK